MRKKFSKKKVVLLLIFIFFSFNKVIYASNTSFFQNAYKYNQYSGRVFDHSIPDFCKSYRRAAFKACVTATAICASIILTPFCGIPLAFCLQYLGDYDDCCNKIPAHYQQWSRQQLWNAALCNSCMAKDDVIKPICNQ